MAEGTVTKLRAKTTMRTRKEFSEIEDDLNQIKCILACASAALGHAQDAADAGVSDLEAKSWWVINNCVKDFEKLEDDLQQWHMDHDHSPKREVTHG